MERAQNYGLFLVMTVGWSFSYITNKIGLGYCSPILFGALSTLIGGCTIATLLYGKGANLLKDRRMWTTFGMMGLVSNTSFIAARSLGLNFSDPGIIAVMVYTYPTMVVPLASIFLKEHVSLVRALGILLGFTGIVLLSLNDLTGQIGLSWGELFGLAAAASWAVSTIWYKKISLPINPVVATTIQLITGSLGLFLVMEVFERPRFEICANFVLSLVYTSIIGFGMGSVIWFYLLKREEAVSLSAYLFLVPLLSLFFSHIFYKEALSLISLTGCGLILFGQYAAHRGEYDTRAR